MAKRGTIGDYTRSKLDQIIELKIGGLDDIPITGVTAGKGLSGGGTGGTVTVTVDISDSDLTTATTVQTGDLVIFSDESAANDPTQNITVDNLITKTPALLTEAAVANGDYVVFLDGGATGDAKKEAVHDLATLFAGNGLAAASSVMGIDINGATDGTGITVASGDMVLLADADDSNAVKKVNVSQLPSGGGTTINNATENELVTVASTTSQLDAEANLTFNGSTLTALGGIMANMLANKAAIAVTTTLTAGYNALMLGPITLNDGIVLTVSDGANLKIKDLSEL